MSSGPSERHLPRIAPLTARSVVLSMLLGYSPPELSVRALIRVAALFEIAEPTVRVALTRMTADGDLVADRGVYRLTERLLDRQQRQDELRAPRTVAWDGSWEMVAVDARARPVAARTSRRRLLLGLRLAELREGVWLRPGNLVRPAHALADHGDVFRSHHDDSRSLAHRLWDLETWADDARRLHAGLAAAAGLRDGFLVIAETVRHLQVDPVLPPELLPTDWPGPALRARYAEVRDAYAARLRDYGEAVDDGGHP